MQIELTLTGCHDSMLCTWKACFQDTVPASKSEDDASDEGHKYLRIAFTLTMLVSKYGQHQLARQT